MREGDEKPKTEGEPLLRVGMTPGELNEVLLGEQSRCYVGAHKLPSRRGPQPEE